MITFIIPFYQTKSGLLKLAVNSIIECNQADVSIIVIDDGSPISAESEIGEILRDNNHITLLKQSNSGVASARNKGLDFIDETTEYIAFLDADDCLNNEHIEKMKMAFTAGADFYFSNIASPDGTSSKFDWMDFKKEPIEQFDELHNLWWYTGHLIDLAAQGRLPIQTSTMAYRFSIAKDIRFSEKFYRCSEDHHFFVRIAGRAKKIAFSTSCDISCGTGVSLHRSAIWGTIPGLERISDAARFHTYLDTLGSLTAEAKENNKKNLANSDKDFSMNVIILMLKERLFPFQLLKEYFKLRPKFILSLGPALFQLIENKVKVQKII